MSKNTSLAILYTTVFIFCSSVTAVAQNYYPINVGNEWGLQSEDGTELITHTVEASEESINGMPLVLLKITNETIGTDVKTAQKLFVDVDEEGIHLYKFVAELGPVFGVATALIYPPALYYPSSLQHGDTWEITADSEANLSGPFTFTSTNKVTWKEDVVTPAGTFENCLKIRLQTKITSASGASRATAYQWLAPDIGPVQFESSQDVVYKLVSYNLLEDKPNYDVTGDGIVNILDLVYVASRFGKESTEGDVNNDGKVDILDLTLIAQNFGD